MAKWMASLWQSLVNGPRPAGGTPGLDFERRQAPRYPCGLDVLCLPATAANASPVPVRMCDISAGGIGILSPRCLEAGTLVEVERPGLPGRPPLRVVSCVRHVRQAGNAWVMGCSFIRELDDQELRAFQQS